MAVPQSVSTVVDQLKAAGFTDDAAVRSAAEARGVPLAHNGDYEVLAALSKGDVQVVVERNSAPDEVGGESVTTYPPVARITGPRGTVNARCSDPEAVLAVASDAA